MTIQIRILPATLLAFPSGRSMARTYDVPSPIAPDGRCAVAGHLGAIPFGG